ncbi:MarC family protein [Glaciimonas sp. CA11.2]|uniref:MarC family protein n=1 Tax=unclassified Glaciimonas TaxID=2644401 RepID=UPI002AB45558|nr:MULTISPECIES: MarC family protein [unclassified Glaciimonas]MDY7546617.1 MarC family protein [Glaciimonas sp. CA11.2]MEB0011743.1 MarC family protein [Glaciimonas sp. Cout2]MEB0080701.1 MarC family protein [Glaciimonas sp. Gout2]MEB0163455.1 MarC family protein [Glaciimonas sp. CA11.2]
MQFHLLAFVKTVFFVLAALLPIMNPPGNAPIFHSLTAGASDATRNALAWRVAVNTFILLVAGMFIGTHVLAFFGISLPVVKVAGGLLVIATAWKLLGMDEVQKVETIPGSLWTKELASKKAFYPLTFPFTVGPGSISVAITLGAGLRIPQVPVIITLVAAVAALALASVAVYFSNRFAGVLVRLLGDTGTTVMLRMYSFILLCIGVQILWDGVGGLLLQLRSIGL